MRGSDSRSGSLSSCADLEDRIPQAHPLRVIRRIAGDVLAGISKTLSAVARADAHIRPGATLAGDKGFDTADLVAELRERRITPNVVQDACDTGKARRRSSIDGGRTLHPGYAISQRIRERLEVIFGWLTTVAAWRRSRFRGLDRTEHGLHLALGADNPARMPKLPARVQDDGDQRSGRGWIEPGTAGRLGGHPCFPMGDDSGFVCEPW